MGGINITPLCFFILICICFDPFILIIRLNYLRVTVLSSLRVLIDGKVCDLDVGLRLIFGAEAEMIRSVRPLKSYMI